MARDAQHLEPGNKHVFVVNGSVMVLDFIRELLQAEHYNVTTTNYVPRTWDQISALQPNLLMVDLVIGQEVGWDLLEHLQQEANTRNIPVIVFSTDQTLLDRAVMEQHRFGGQRFLAKPFDIQELLTMV
ncbi:MAG: response regulator, partial [Nitrolancea sp.]